MPTHNNATLYATTDTLLATADIRRLIATLRRGGHYYEDGDFVVLIGDHHFATPEARGALWQMVARLVELETEAAYSGGPRGAQE